jgi:hypothetical protein
MGLNVSIEADCLVVDFGALNRGDSILVRCLETVYDDFYRPGGLAFKATVNYRVEDGRVSLEGGISAICREPRGGSAQYLYEFQQWLRSQNRWIPGMIEVLDASPASMPCGPYPFLHPLDEESLERLAKEIVVFVEASANWPKSS